MSEPTLYRHFGSRERLLEELDRHVQGKLGFPAIPDSAAEFPDHVESLFGTFGEHAPLLRATVESGVGREMRSRGRRNRGRKSRDIVRAHAPALANDEVERITGVIRVLASWESFEMLTTEMGMSGGDASRAVRWALETLLRDVNGRGRAARAVTKTNTKRTQRRERER